MPDLTASLTSAFVCGTGRAAGHSGPDASSVLGIDRSCHSERKKKGENPVMDACQ